MKRILKITSLSILLFSATSHADNIFGEFKRVPDVIERGFSVGFDFGFLFLTKQPPSTTATNPGFNLNFTTGYDIFNYLSIEGVYMVGINQAAANDPLLDGSVISLAFDGAVKVQYPLFERFYPFVEAGVGIYHSKPSWTFPSQNNVMNYLFSAGAEYYTYLRHFSLYMKGTYVYVQKIDPKLLTVTLGLKYTF